MLTTLQSGCRKFIVVDAPVTSVSSLNVYSEDGTATSVLTGIYANISNSEVDLGGPSPAAISLYAGLSADELSTYGANDYRLTAFYLNDLNSRYSSGYGLFWDYLYSIIYTTNSAIEGMTSSPGLTPAIKQQLLGEAKFVRGFCYFYLVNIYGDVPLAVTSDFKTNSLLPRSPKTDVYKQIITDLSEAESLLSSEYLHGDALTVYPAGSEQRVRPTKWSAAALLARVYLFSGDDVNAEVQSTMVIENPLFSLSNLDGAFKMNGAETIWSLQPVSGGAQSNTGDGLMFVLPADGPNTGANPVYLNHQLLDSFEWNDQRRYNWVDSVIVDTNVYYYAYKYKIGAVDTTTQEYTMVLRLGEQYLIRAESRAQQGNIAGASSDLNAIRNRAGLPPTTATDQLSLLSAILHERQVELFTEWGHRWFDLKRTGAIDPVMNIAAPLKGAIWSPFKALFPIPQIELNTDPNLVQNAGY